MSYNFFQNKTCEYFPCHNGCQNKKTFNCLFCFCPLYGNSDCGGNYTTLENGVKDCSNCTIPHYHYDYIIHKLTKNREDNRVLTIQIKYHSDTLTKIEKIEKGDWIDLRAAETVNLKQGEFRLISLGVSMKLPSGYEAHIAPRSSTFKKWGILQVNSVGVVDESYCGNDDIWRMPVYATRDTTIEENDRICQFRIVEKMPAVDFCQVDALADENRGGFGSTGQK